MISEAALLAVSCVLFVNMGLSDALQEELGIKSRILSCPKCLTFWSTLAYLAFSKCRIFTAVGASFLFSYAALWLDLGLSALNRIYNEKYEQILSAAAGRGNPSPSGKERKRAKPGEARSGMPEVRKKKR